MRNCTNLYIVASPLQLICVLEYKLLINDKEGTLILVQDRLAPTALSDMSVGTNWGKIIKIRNRNGIDYIRQIYHLVRLKLFFSVDKLIIGDLRGYNISSMATMNFKIKDKIVLVDDGSATLTLKKNYIDKGELYLHNHERSGAKVKFKLLLFRLLNLNYKFIPSITLFTFFRDKEFTDDPSVIYHSFDCLKKTEINEFNTQSNIVYFIGGPYVETDLMRGSDYLSILLKVKNKLSFVEDVKWIYVAHRRENDDNLKHIKSETGMNVVRFNKPIELSFISAKEKPVNVVSLYSTALYSLKILFSPENIIAIKPNMVIFPKENHNEISMVYKYYANSGIEVIDCE